MLGWIIWEGPDHPITGKWRAVKHGVSMGHNTKEGLVSMITERERGT